jgi:hypothetical protein
MYFLNEEQPERKRVHTMRDILGAIVDQIEDRSSKKTTLAKGVERILSSAHLRDVNRLRRVAQFENLGPDVAEPLVPSSNRENAGLRKGYGTGFDRVHLAAEIENLKHELETIRSSRSWRVTAPLRSVARVVRRLRA